jgi:preprotein translocase subunit SecG
MHAFLSATQVFFSIILIALILMHSGKDAGLSGAFGVGGGSQIGSGSLVERNLNRWTVAFALLFVANVFLLLKT